MSSFTIQLKQQQFAFIGIILYTSFCVHNSNCSIDLYNIDLQTTIIFFTQNWLNSLWISVACFVLSFISHGKQSNESTCRKMSLPSRNLYKRMQLTYSVTVAFFFVAAFLYCTLLQRVYFFILLFYTDVVAIFLFIRWSCRQSHYFCYWSFCLTF